MKVGRGWALLKWETEPHPSLSLVLLACTISVSTLLTCRAPSVQQPWVCLPFSQGGEPPVVWLPLRSVVLRVPGHP